MSRYFRTQIVVEILSEVIDGQPDPNFGDMTLAEIGEAITTGDCSGTVEVVSQQQVEMAVLLQSQGSEPSFLGLTEG